MDWNKQYYDELWSRVWSRGNSFLKSSEEIKKQKEFPGIQYMHLGEGRKLNACVLFVDVVSFTQRSQYLPPEKLLLTLHVFLSEIVKIVTDYGGEVEKFTGDGLMAIFDSSYTDIPTMVKKAIDAATTIRFAIKDPINSFLKHQEIEPINFRIGIDGGELIIGKLGIGTSNELVAIGWAANIASKLQELAPVNGILIGNYVHSQLPTFEKEYCLLQLIPTDWNYVKSGTVEKYPFFAYTAEWKIPV